MNNRLYGGYSIDGTATSNTATITGGEASFVYGGYSVSSTADSNAVYVTGGTVGFVYGGYTEGTDATATKNTVTISEGSTVGSSEKTVLVYGGYSLNGTATGNTVTMTGGTVNGKVLGSYSGSGNVEGNTVTMTGGTVTVNVSGGSSDSGTSKGNTATMIGGTVNGKVYGGYSNSGASTGNTATMTGGEVNDKVYGGYSETGKVESNTATMTGGTVNGRVLGGYSGSGNVEGNTATIEGGSVSENVSGGSSDSGTSKDNKAIIEGGKVAGKVYGGYSASGNATGNAVTLKGGTLGSSETASNVYGGYTGGDNATATGNTVAIVATSDTVEKLNLTYTNLYGSNKDATAVVTGTNANKLDLTQMATAITVKSINKFNEIIIGSNTATLMTTDGGDLNYTTIDATAIASAEGFVDNERVLLAITAESGFENLNNAVLKLSETLTSSKVMDKIAVGDNYGVAYYGYEGSKEANKISIKAVAGDNIAGVYYTADGKGHALDADNKVVEATSGTLNISGELDTTDKTYAGAYAEGSQTATGGTVAIVSSANVTGDLYAGYSASGSGKVESNTMTVADGATLANAKLHGSNKDVTVQATSGTENVLDLTAVSTDTTIASIDSFDLVKLGSGTISVTANSSFANATIDATNITKITGTECDLIVASGSGVSLDVTNTTVKLSDSLKAPYEADATSGISGGIYKVGYEGKATAQKISIAKSAGTNVAGLYIASDGKGYNKDDLTKGEAKSGTLTISSDVSETGKSYYGAYAEGEQTATGGTLEVTTGGTVNNAQGGYSKDGAVTGNTVNVEDGTVRNAYGGSSYNGAVTSNTATIAGGTVKVNCYGGSSYDGAVTSNAATVTGGIVNGNVYGGYSRGTVTSNAATITGGTVKGSVYGGWNYDKCGGVATSNIVTLKGGTVGTGEKVANVYGGRSSYHVATSNTVTLKGGTVGTGEKVANVYGGYSDHHAATDNTVTLEGGKVGTSEKEANVYGGYSGSGTATGNKVAIVATSTQAPDLTNANLYGSNIAATGTNNNTLDLSNVTTALTVKSISNFDAITMGVGTITVTANSSFANATIDATNITKITGTECDLIVASGSGVSLDVTNTTVKLNDSLKAPYEADATTSGVYKVGYEGKATAEKISIAKSEGTNVAGLYIASDGKGYNKDDLTGGEATSGTLTISDDVTTTGKVYYGSYAEGSQTATDGTLEVKTGGVVAGKTYGGYSESGAVTGNTANIAGGEVDGKIYGGYSDGSGAVTGNTATMTNGTVDGKILGGYSRTGKVEGNTVNIAGGTVSVNVSGGSSDSGNSVGNKANVTGGKVNNRVYGGYSIDGTATGNTATITGGEASFVYGGYSETGKVENNTATMTDGTVSNVSGGFSLSDVATGNSVTLSGGTVTNDVYGGIASGATKSNTVTMTGGIVGSAGTVGSVQGGYSKDGATTESNTVTIEGSNAQVIGHVYGGRATGDAKSNEVAIASGASVSGDVYGGFSASGIAESNKVTLKGDGTQVDNEVYGGYASSDAKSNEVTITSGASVTSSVSGALGSTAESNKVTVEGTGTQVMSVILGASATGDAKSNEVTIASGASVTSGVFGAMGSTAESNKVTVEGTGTQVMSVISGAYAKGSAKSNVVAITSGASVTSGVFGAMGSTAESNKVTVEGTGTQVTGEVYGAHASSDVNGNLVAITSGATVAKDVYGGYSVGGVGGTAESNKVTVEGTGTQVNSEVFGAYAEGSAKSNVVEIASGASVGGDVCGGYSYMAGVDVTSNTVNITGTDTEVTGYVHGGFSKNGNAVSNSLSIDGGTANGDVYGGWGYTGATGNSMTISGGTVGSSEKTVSAYGGYSSYRSAKGNTATIIGGTVNGKVYGGYSGRGSVEGNTANIEGGTVTGSVYGGSSGSSTVENNTATMTGGTVNGKILGGYSKNGNVEGNTVNIEDGTVTVNVSGGSSDSGTSKGNTANITGGTVNGKVYGGYSNSGTATGNTATIEGGEVNDKVYGGYSVSGNVESNTATMTYGTVNGRVLGGYSASGNVEGNTANIASGMVSENVSGGSSDSGTSKGNTANVTGGTVNNRVYGGYSASGNVESNTANVTGGTVNGNVYGGYTEGTTATASTNTVTIGEGTIVGSSEKAANVYGGYSASATADGNIVNILGGTVNGDVYAGYSASSIVTGGTVNISGNATKITGNVYGGHGTSVSGTTVNWDGGTITGDVAADTVNVTGNNSAERTKTQKITATTISVAKDASLSYEGNLDLTNTTKLTVAGSLSVTGNVVYNAAKGSIVADGGSITAASTSFVDSNITALSAATNAFATDKDTTLNVVFDAASNTTYSTAQLTALKEAYYSTLGEDVQDAKLNLINATLKVDDNTEQMVVKREDDSTGTEITIKTTPQVVDKNNNKKETTVAVVPTSYVAVAQQAEGKSPELQTVEKVTIKSDFASKGLQVASETGKVEMEIAGSVVMTGGSDESSGIVVDENGKGLTANIKVVGEEDKKGYFAIGVATNTADQKGKLGEVSISANASHALVGNNAKQTDYTYGTLAIGKTGDKTATVAITNAALKITHLSAKGGSFFVDPAYVNVEYAEDDGKFDTDFYVGKGSVVNIEGDGAELKSIAQDLGLNVKDASTGFTVGDDETMLGLEGNYTLGSGTKLIVDSAVDSSGLDANNATNADVYFGDKSLLVVNGYNINSSTAALTLSGQSVDVAEEAKLYLRNALSNKNYTIVSGADKTKFAVNGWGNGGTQTGETTLYANRLLKYTTTGVDDGSYIITTLPDLDPSAFQGSFVYPALKEIADNNLLDADSSYGGIKFLSRATDATYIGDAQMTPVMEEMAAIAATSGVQHTALRASDLVVDTIGEHLTAAKAEKGANLWATPLRTSLTTTSRTESTANISGIMVGYDNGNEKGRFGVAIQGGWGTSHSEGTVSYYQNKNKFAGVSLYGSQKIGKFDLKASLGYTKFGNDVRTHLASGLNMGLVNTDIDAKAFTADVRVERTYETKSGLGITPHVGLRYTRLATDSYDNNIISGDSEKQNIWQLPIGVTFAQTLSKKEGWTLRPYLDLSFVPAFGGKETDSRVRFTGLNSVVSSATRIVSSTSFLGSLGFTAEKGNFGMGLSYYLQKGSSETNNTFALNLNWKF